MIIGCKGKLETRTRVFKLLFKTGLQQILQKHVQS